MGAILTQAQAIHEAACRPYRGAMNPHLAYPFGTPVGMPPHRWRVSTDVLQALANASGELFPTNPKDTHGEERRLFGWPVERDAALPRGTMLLEPHDPELEAALAPLYEAP